MGTHDVGVDEPAGVRRDVLVGRMAEVGGVSLDARRARGVPAAAKVVGGVAGEVRQRAEPLDADVKPAMNDSCGLVGREPLDVGPRVRGANASRSKKCARAGRVDPLASCAHRVQLEESVAAPHVEAEDRPAFVRRELEAIHTLEDHLHATVLPQLVN